MNVNSVNTNFTGRIYLQNPESWTKSMKQALTENESVRDTLSSGYDIVGKIKTKKEKKEPPYFSNHQKGDTLYKMSLVVQNESDRTSLASRIKDFFSKIIKDEYIINEGYRSESTTVARLKKLFIE